MAQIKCTVNIKKRNQCKHLSIFYRWFFSTIFLAQHIRNCQKILTSDQLVSSNLFSAYLLSLFKVFLKMLQFLIWCQSKSTLNLVLRFNILITFFALFYYPFFSFFIIQICLVCLMLFLYLHLLLYYHLDMKLLWEGLNTRLVGIVYLKTSFHPQIRYGDQEAQQLWDGHPNASQL